MGLGAAVGFLDAAAIIIHLAGPTGAIRLVNVALAKQTLIAAGGLMTCGAVTARIAHQREQRRLDAAATVTRLP
jgi:hypothetical protein